MTVLRAAGVIAALFFLPATADAGTLTRTGDALKYTATAGGETVQVGTDGVPFVESAGLLPPGGCSGTGRVFCPSAKVIALTFMAGAENNLDGAAISDLMTITAVGGATDDRLTGGPNTDFLSGGSGTDNLDGGAGNDTLEGGPGENYLSDGAGNDVLVGGADNDTWYAGTGSGADSFNPGAGTDSVSYSGRSNPVTITLAGGTDDGEAGEGDDVGTNAELAYGGGGNDVLVANNLGNELSGGDGNDSLKGGTGADRLVGNEGDDTIDARDGRDDSIDCGTGNDVVYADPADSTENCEVAPDRDGDGVLNEADCAPDNAAIRPGAGEIIGNAVDEDCANGPLYARVVSPVSYSIKRLGNKMRFTKLTVGEIKPGDRIEIRCSTKARGCPFTRKTVTGKNKRTVSVLAQFKSRYLRKGAVIEFRTLRANEIGSVRRLTVGSRGNVKSQLLCLNVGATTPTRCA